MLEATQGAQAHVSQVNRSPVEQQPLCTSSALRWHTNPWLSVSSHLRTAGAAGQVHAGRLQAARAQPQSGRAHLPCTVLLQAPSPSRPCRCDSKRGMSLRAHSPGDQTTAASGSTVTQRGHVRLSAPPQQLPEVAALAASPQCIATGRCTAQSQQEKQHRQRMGPGGSWRARRQAPAHRAIPLLALLVSTRRAKGHKSQPRQFSCALGASRLPASSPDNPLCTLASQPTAVTPASVLVHKKEQTG